MKEARFRLRLTQDEMAKRLGISGNYVYLLESGRENPGPKLLAKFEDIEAAAESKTNLREGVESKPAKKTIEDDRLSVGLLDVMSVDLLERTLKEHVESLPVADARKRGTLLANIERIAVELQRREKVTGSGTAAAGAKALTKAVAHKPQRG